MNLGHEVKSERGEAAISSFSSQSNKSEGGHATRTRPLNPHADLEFADGRRFRITELRAFDAHGAETNAVTGETGTTGRAPRWEVEMEVQGDGRGDNFVFRVRIAWSAVRRGELERVGYGGACDRPTAIFLLARERVWAYLRNHRSPPRYSSHQWAVNLLVE